MLVKIIFVDNKKLKWYDIDSSLIIFYLKKSQKYLTNLCKSFE